MQNQPANVSPTRDVLAVILLIVLGTLATGSFLLHPFDVHLPRCSEPYDAAIYPWNFRWLLDSWTASDGSLLFSRRFYWPDGESLALYTPTYFYAAMSVPLQWLFGAKGAMLAVAIFLVWATVATAGLTYALARSLACRPMGAFLAAALFSLCSGRMMNAARLNLFGTEFLILFLLLGLWFWRRGSLRTAIAFGASGAVLLLQSQPLFFQAALAVCVVGLGAAIHWLLWRRSQGLRPWRPLLIALVVFVFGAGPFLWTMIHDLQSSSALSQSEIMLQIPDSSLNLSSLVVPNPGDVFYGKAWAGRDVTFFEGKGFEGELRGAVSFFLGFGWWALLLVALTCCARRLWLPVLLATLALFLLAMGPIPRLSAETTLPIPSLYGLLSWFPLVKLSKSPVRLVLLVQLGCALLAGYGVDRLMHGRRWPQIAAVVLTILAVAEQWDTLPLRSLGPRHTIPNEMASIAEEPGEFSILDLPFDGAPNPAHRSNSVAMALGAIHGRPIFFGLFPRASKANLYQTLAPTTLAQWLLRANECASNGQPITWTETEVLSVRQELDELKVRHIMVHDIQDSPPLIRANAANLKQLMQAVTGPPQTLSVASSYELTWFRRE